MLPRAYRWIAACITLFTLVLAPMHTQAASAIRFTPTTIPLEENEIANPGRGLYRWTEQTYVAPKELISNRDSYRRFQWQDLEPEQGVYDFTKLDEFIADAVDHGQRAILGLPQPVGPKSNGDSRMPAYLTSDTYGTWWNGTFWPNFNNQFVLERFESLVKALGSRYNGDTRVAMIQMTHYGAYGEYYVPSDAPENVSRISRENAERTIAIFRAAFPTKQLSAMIGLSGGGYVTRAALLASQDIGLSRMALGCDEQMQKIDAAWGDPEIGQLLQERWKYAPVWTEMIGGFLDRCPDPFAQAAEQVPHYHISYVSNGNFSAPYNLAPYDRQGRRDRDSAWTQQNIDNMVLAGKRAGYRYVVKQVEASTPNAGAAWRVRTAWANDGVAPIYEPWNVRFQLRNEQDAVVWEGTSSVNLRTVLPADGTTTTYTIDDTFTLPSSLAEGTYRLRLFIPALNEHVAPLQLAIRGQQPDGSYALGDLEIGSQASSLSAGTQRASSTMFLPMIGIASGAGSNDQIPPVPPTSPTPPAPPTHSGAIYYVSKDGSGGDGRSWEKAWTDMDQIAWSKLKPGDAVQIAAGSYTKPLIVGANGTAEKPIFIEAVGGEVRLFGGRETPLPYCNQADYRLESSGNLGIDVSGRSHIVIDGGTWGGIKVYGWQRGIQLDSSTSHVRVRYVEVFDNGVAERDRGVWLPGEEGVYVERSSDITFERVQIHDNGHDAFQVYGGVTNFTLRESWVYNARKDPSGGVFNACRHPDGLQVVQAERSRNILFQESVLGPGLYHTILSNQGTLEGIQFKDALIYEALTSTIAVRTASARGWVMDHVTSVRPEDGQMNLEISGSGHSLTNSLIIGGRSNKLPSDTKLQNNYQFQVEGARVGPDVDPRFRNPAGGDYTPGADVGGAGSRLTSVAELMARP